MASCVNTTTNPPKLFKLVLNFSFPARRPRTQRLRVRAVGTLDGWHFCIADYESRQPVASDFGPLPTGFIFNRDTATLYAFANAARWIACNLPGAVVAMVCTEAAREARRERRAA